MHKFSTETYRSLCSASSEHHAWRTEIPRKALEYDFLLSSILATAALQTAATLGPPAALDYIDTALQYHNMALAPYRRALESLTPLNYDAVFAHALLTIVIGIALPQLPAKNHESSSMTETIFVLFGLLQGVNELSRIGRPWLGTGLLEYKGRFWDYHPPILHLENDTETALDRLEAMNDDDVSARVDANQHRINKDALSLLRHCFTRFESMKDAASVLAWLTIVNKEFVHGLRRRQPFPLLILMHWAVLLGELDGRIWWAQNSGKALVSELLVALRPDGGFEWNSAQRWVQQKMGLQYSSRSEILRGKAHDTNGE
jgi:hypothetical protein